MMLLPTRQRMFALAGLLMMLSPIGGCRAEADGPAGGGDRDQKSAAKPDGAKPDAERHPAFSLDFKDPGPGPRAPTSAAFHVQIGASDLAAVSAKTEALGLLCADTSVRAQMQAMREKKAEEAKADGKAPDATSSASWNKPSKRESLPQVRFSCGKVESSVVDDNERPPSRGRLLYVFDSEDLPVRHASYQRTHASAAKAYADVSESLERMRSIYGEPTSNRHVLPTPDETGEVDFELLEAIEYTWTFSDLLVKVSAMRVNPQSVTVGERVEVPIGIRPDAPTLPKG